MTVVLARWDWRVKGCAFERAGDLAFVPGALARPRLAVRLGDAADALAGGRAVGSDGARAASARMAAGRSSPGNVAKGAGRGCDTVDA
jgi:hypothetical protein